MKMGTPKNVDPYSRVDGNLGPHLPWRTETWNPHFPTNTDPLYVVSQARLFASCSTDCFQYRHTEEGSGDLGSLHVNIWNAIFESVTCKAYNYS